MIEATRVTFRPGTKGHVLSDKRPTVTLPDEDPSPKKRRIFHRGAMQRIVEACQASPHMVFTTQMLADQLGLPVSTINGSAGYAMTRGLIQRVGMGCYRWAGGVEEEETREVADGYDFAGWLPDGQPVLRHLDSDELVYGSERLVVRRVRKLVPRG